MKRRSKLEITAHGDMYIPKDDVLFCPECYSMNLRVEWDKRGIMDRKGTIVTRYVDKIDYLCKDCSCRFTIKKNRGYKIDHETLVGILVVLLVIAAFTSLIVMACLEA